jgi:hypothetical protein
VKISLFRAAVLSFAATLVALPALASDPESDFSPARRYSLHVAGGVATSSGAYGALALVGIEMPTGARSAVRLGVESGALLGSGRGIPVLGSFLLRSDELTRGVSPFLGISAGPVFTSGGGVFGAGDSVKLALFLRAGARYPIGRAIDAMPELWIGGLTGVFLMAPVLKLSVYL